MKNAIDIINRKYPSLSAIEKRIAAFILEAPEKVIYMTTAALSKQLGVSQGSVIKFANNLGFSGYSELKLNVAQNLPGQEKILAEEVTEKDSAHDVLAKLSREITQTFQMTLSAIQNSELEAAAHILCQKRRIEIYGVGSSSMVANDAYYRFMRQGLPAYGVTDPHIASVSASFLDEGCAVIAISHSGRTVETLNAVRIAKTAGASVICLTSFPDSPLARSSDVCLVSASKESARLKEALTARHSQLLILDALLMYISFKDVVHAIECAENVSEIIGEHRTYE